MYPERGGWAKIFDFYGMRRAVIDCGRGAVVICVGDSRPTLADLRRLCLRLTSGGYSGKKRNRYSDFFGGRTKSKAIPDLLQNDHNGSRDRLLVHFTSSLFLLLFDIR
jgi:hypothetical protein